MSKTKHVSVNGGGCGCISVILTCLLIWATCFGVTYKGTHYGLSCSCDKGVEFK